MKRREFIITMGLAAGGGLALGRLALARCPEAGEVLRGTLDRVIDGDTIAARLETAACGVVIRRIRLGDGCDTPERNQPWGPEATLRTGELLAGGFIVEYTAKATYGRAVARIYLADGRRLAMVLVSEGLAWVDPRYAKGEWGKKLTAAMAKAKAAKVGLWGDDRPIEPRQWRKGVR